MVKDIDERKCIKKLKPLIIKKVRQLINLLIFQAPLSKKSMVSKSKEAVDGQVQSIVRVNINDCDSNSDETINVVSSNNSVHFSDTINSNHSETLLDMVSNAVQGKTNLQDKGVLQSLNKAQIRKPYVESMISSRDVNPSLCSECGLVFMSDKRLNNHIKLYHSEQTCVHCDKTFSNLIELRRHKKILKQNEYRLLRRKSAIDKTKRFYCSACDMDCQNSEKLLKHNLKIHNIGEYLSCDKCNKKFISKSNLLMHKKQMHLIGNSSKTNICEFCGKIFQSRSILCTHVYYTHKRKAINHCPICNEETRSVANFKLHITKHMNGANKEEHDVASKLINSFKRTLQCLVCRLKYNEDEEDKLKQHLAFHENDPDIEKVKEELVGEDTGKLLCRICKKRFPKEKVLAMHRFFIHKEMPYICKVENCGTAFWTNWDLEIHKKSTHIIHDYSCKLCGENFISYVKKMDHMKTQHPGEQDKPFLCEICNRSFTAPVFLKMHMISHRVEKEFKCKICGKECATSGAFQKHVQSHNRMKEVKRALKAKRCSKPKEEQQSNVDEITFGLEAGLVKDEVEVVGEQVIMEVIDQDMTLTENVIAVENLEQQMILSDGILAEIVYQFN